MQIKMKKTVLVLVVSYFTLVSLVNAQGSYSPHIGQSLPTNVFWGDTHLHTSLSMDTIGNNLGPEEAYRFAKGEAVIASNGMKVRLGRPLDFLVIADHAAYMGVRYPTEAGAASILKTGRGKYWADLLKKIRAMGQTNLLKSDEILNEVLSDDWVKGKLSDKKFIRSIWEHSTALADKHNDPEKFTALQSEGPPS